MTKPFDENRAGATFRYEIGKKRFDGRYNVWTLIEMLPQQWSWVIVFVAPTWRIAKQWITDTETKEITA